MPEERKRRRGRPKKCPSVSEVQAVVNLSTRMTVEEIQDRLRSIERADGSPSLYLKFLERKLRRDKRQQVRSGGTILPFPSHET
ncbi:MAG: hypothetical protein AAF517_28105 [Planctomycetota bacterium]